MPKIGDPSTYRAMLVPHDSADAANEALAAFHEGMRELRKKHRIAEVNFIAKVLYVGEDGEEREGAAPIHIGDPSHAGHMSAFAAGYWASDADALRAANTAAGQKRARQEK